MKSSEGSVYIGGFHLIVNEFLITVNRGAGDIETDIRRLR
jgi:hypothetical protein